MLVQKLVEDHTWSVRQGDTVADAVSMMTLVQEQELPVVDEDGRLVGMITGAITDEAAPNQPIGSLHLEPRYALNADAHVYNAVAAVLHRNMRVLPVVDDDDNYLGLLTRRTLFLQCAHDLGIHLSGAILEVEMPERDYAVGKLVHAIEQSDAKILSLASDLSSYADGVTRVTVKIDAADASRIRHVLEHYGIRVIASFNEHVSAADLEMRVREFMRYLEV